MPNFVDFMEGNVYNSQTIEEKLSAKRVVKYKAWMGENDGDEIHVYVNNVLVFSETGHLNSSDDLKALLTKKRYI